MISYLACSDTYPLRRRIVRSAVVECQKCREYYTDLRNRILRVGNLKTPKVRGSLDYHWRPLSDLEIVKIANLSLFGLVILEFSRPIWSNETNFKYNIITFTLGFERLPWLPWEVLNSATKALR